MNEKLAISNNKKELFEINWRKSKKKWGVMNNEKLEISNNKKELFEINWRKSKNHNVKSYFQTPSKSWFEGLTETIFF